MLATTPRTALHLRNLHITHEEDPSFPAGTELLLPGVLVIRVGQIITLLFSPDTLTLITSLWHHRAYGSRGHLLRPTLIGDDSVRLALISGDHERVLATLPVADWRRHLTAMAGAAAEVLVTAGERDSLRLLTPVLANTERPAVTPPPAR